jgi:hypothetical protein
VTATDGVNLNAPTLLDLPSDKPIDRTIGPIINPTDRSDVSASEGLGLKDKEKLLVAHFKF